ncbi:YciI family protein [Celeribacter indicus]|uniref:YCII-related domain-containing protein n=1 Tax=Celeribacter indicus TaxID=1208324 RepID=A0A0B5DTH8_9RHOB|nr:YciI family protein [Celeribacter indicus]AJE46733.1 hypothetical protein P73_2018 [Celeribacter indicus]SDX05095.1 hypothetical protein SAMN05443573_11239 [Celeribacter indicus]
MSNDKTSNDKAVIAELLGRMMAKEYYMIENRMLADPSDLGPHLADHLRFMIGLEKAGVLFLSGPLYDRDGKMTGEGITVVRASSFEEAEEIAQRDPFVIAGLREPRVQRWVVNEGRISLNIDLSDRGSVLE